MLRLRPSRISAPVAVGAVMLGTCLAWALVASQVAIPRWYLDELYYMEAAVSMAQGDGLGFRGEPWGYGPLYPLLLAAIVAVSTGQEAAYELAKAANAIFFALAALPLYLVARRLLPPWPSAGFVGLCALLPSSAYVSVVMTESLAYLVSCWVVLALVYALEQPTVGRQLLVLAGCLGAIAIRPQLVALAGGYVVGLVLVCACFPAQRAAVARAPLTLWPTGAALVAGVAWLARPLITGDGLGDALGDYAPLAGSYDPLLTAAWAARSLGGLAVYLAVVPAVVAPVVLTRWWVNARRGDAADGAVAAAFVGVNAVLVAVAAAFITTEYGHRILHDRYLFYIAPLWLLGFVVWLHDGLPRPRGPLLAGVAGTVVLVMTLPWGLIGEDRFFTQFEALGTEMWGKIGALADVVPVVSIWMAAAVFVVVLAAAAAALPRRLAWVLVVAVAVGLVGNTLPAWRSAFVDLTANGVARRAALSWVDDSVGQRADVTLLFVARDCDGPERGAYLATDFFNRSVRRALTVGGEGPAAPRAATIGRDGVVVAERGATGEAPFVVAQRGVVVDGRRIAEGTAAGLVLWRVDGPLTVRGGLSGSACRVS